MTELEQSILNFLSRTHYFRDCTRSSMSEVVSLFKLVQLKAGERLFEQGSASDGWFLLFEGELIILSSQQGRPDFTLAYIEEGEGFGEMALLEESTRMASVEASADSLLFWLPHSSFQELLEQCHPVAVRMLRAMATDIGRRQRELTVILQDLVDDPGPQIRLPVTQSILSN